MRVYLSGAITNDPNYKQKFVDYEKIFTELGYQVVNPVTLCGGLPELSHAEYLRICCTALSVCDTIFVIDGYGESKGVMTELDFASKNGVYRLWKIKGLDNA